MPRQASSISSDNAASSAVVTLDVTGRVMIPQTVAQTITWIPTDNNNLIVECIAVLGPSGGIQVDHVDGRIARQRHSILERLQQQGSVAEDQPFLTKRMEVARYFAVSWQLTIHVMKHRHRLSVPRDIRRLGILPDEAGEKVVLFGIDDVLELWSPTDWINYQRELPNRAPELFDEVVPTRSVFISYSSADESIAQELAGVLTKLNVSFFLDRKDVQLGDRIVETISAGISTCSDVMVVISPASHKSQWVPFELGQAVAHQKRILPYLTHPSLDLPDYLKNIHYKTSLREVEEFFRKDLAS